MSKPQAIVLRGDVSGLAKRSGFALLTLAMSMVITATYHLGYEHYREDRVREPETGNVAISLPVILSANPLGSLLAHTTLHEAAVAHSYETDTFLPPQTSAD